MTEHRRFLAARGTLVVVLALAFSLTGHHVGDASPPERSSAGRSGASIESSQDSPPESAPKRLVTETEKDSKAGPALWIGLLMGISGLAGLFFSLGGKTPGEDG